MQIKIGLLASAAAVAIGAFGSIRADAPPTYSIDFSLISASSDTLRGNCYRISGTAGQPAPGYSSGGVFALLSGYWSVAPITNADEIFLNSFEGCTP